MRKLGAVGLIFQKGDICHYQAPISFVEYFIGFSIICICKALEDRNLVLFSPFLVYREILLN